jgi:hypothetical protein
MACYPAASSLTTQNGMFMCELREWSIMGAGLPSLHAQATMYARIVQNLKTMALRLGHPPTGGVRKRLGGSVVVFADQAATPSVASQS